MFEVKIESVIEKNPGIIQQNFLDLTRRKQICDIIDSLTEEQFLSLHENIVGVFNEVSKLHKLIIDGLDSGSSYQSVYDKIVSAYQQSSENTQYYKEEFLKVIEFLNKRKEKWEHIVTKEQEMWLKLEFEKLLMRPHTNFRNILQEKLCRRESVKEPILGKSNDFTQMMRVSLIEKQYDFYQWMMKKLSQVVHTHLNTGKSISEKAEHSFTNYQPMFATSGFLIDTSQIIETILDIYDEYYSSRTELENDIKKKVKLKINELHKLGDKIEDYSKEKGIIHKISFYNKICEELYLLIKDKSSSEFPFHLTVLVSEVREMRNTSFLEKLLQCIAKKNSEEKLKNMVSKIECDLESLLTYNMQTVEVTQLINTTKGNLNRMISVLDQFYTENNYIMSNADKDKLKELFNIDDVLKEKLGTKEIEHKIRNEINQIGQRAHHRGAFYSICCSKFNLTEKQQQKLLEISRLGTLDSVILEIEEAAQSEKYTVDSDANYDGWGNEYDLYVKEKQARAISEDEIIDLFMKGNSKVYKA